MTIAHSVCIVITAELAWLTCGYCSQMLKIKAFYVQIQAVLCQILIFYSCACACSSLARIPAVPGTVFYRSAYIS